MTEDDVLPTASAMRTVRTILVVDVVESVRLIERFEDDTIALWRGLVARVVASVLPQHQGRLVKSLGDGLMIEFPRALKAIEAAFAIQRLAAAANLDLPPERRVLLRIGVHVSSVISDAHDIYGHGVNLTARLAALAGPGEIVASAEVRHLLTPQLDADVEDLGECFLKHISEPVRAYRIGPPGERPLQEGGADDDLRATIAVVPFTSRSAGPHRGIVGQILAESLIATLSLSPELNVVSRLSTTHFQGRGASTLEVGAHLRANYVLSGSYHVDTDRVSLRVELTDVRSLQVIWSGRYKGRVRHVVAGNDTLNERLLAEACAAMRLHELRRAVGRSPPTLECHTLLLNSITLMHQMSPHSLHRAHQLCEALIDRAPRLAAPYAWFAKLHVLRVTQGWSTDAALDGRRALDNTRRALDRDPTSSLAMTVEGQVQTYILKRLDLAEQRYEAALQANPNDALAWLLKGTLHAFRDEGTQAVKLTRRALKLSPLDPLRYYFDSLAATAALAAGQNARALSLAQQSIRLNRTHGSTLRVLIVALWKLERHDEARDAAHALLGLEPAFRISTYLARSPAAQFQTGRMIAEILGKAGIPH